MGKYIIIIIVVYWVANKLDGIRLTRKRKKAARILAEQKAADRIAKENHKLFLAANKWKKEQEQQRKRIAAEQARQEKEQAKAREREEKLSAQKMAAGADLEYINHRLKQLDNLMAIAEDTQSGTIYGGKEWIKAEREIMKLENQAHALHVKAQKARAIRAK